MPAVYVLLASLCFATTGTAQALGPDGTTPSTVGAARILVGAVLLALAARIVRARRRAAAADRRAPRGRAVVVAGLGVAAYQLCFFAAVADTGVAVGTVVALGSAPALAGLAARVALGEALTARWAAATALACTGVLVLVLAGGAADVSAAGVALAVGAGGAYAAFTVASRRLLTAGAGSEDVMAVAFGLGAVLLAPVLVAGDAAWLATGDGLALALFLGAVPTAAAYLLFAAGLRRMRSGEAATLTLAEPVTAALLGAAVLGERPGAGALVGIAIVLAGIALLAAPAPRRPSRTRAVAPGLAA